MQIVVISGKARNGKDTIADFLKQALENDGHKVLVTHYADLLKYICKQFFGWNGEKDEDGRQLLQYIGTDVIRKKKPDYWVQFITSILKIFPHQWDYVLIPDCRFPNEIDTLRNARFNTTHLRIVRSNFDDNLTDEQRAHSSETALDNTEPDYLILNNGTLKDLKNKAIDWVTQFKGSHQVTFDEL